MTTPRTQPNLTPAQAEALEALRSSFEGKWTYLVGDPLAKETDCSLCKRYRYHLDTAECSGCPVRVATGQPRCVGTPYPSWRWIKAAYRKGEGVHGGHVTQRMVQREAHAEQEWLRSLHANILKVLKKLEAN